MALTELEDTEWFPKILRDQQLGYIGWLVHFLDLYRPIVQRLPQWIRESNLDQVQDLCSGSGEPVITLSGSFRKTTRVTLSDKFIPEEPYHSDTVHYNPDSIDVLDLQVESNTYYTMFNAFHHFDDSQQKDIVHRIIQKEAPFCFVEILQPDVITLLKVIFVNTIGQLLFAPFVRPFSFTRLLLTYFLPVNLLTTTYDGIISVLKSKNKKQYQTLLQQLPSDNYRINIESQKAPFFNNLIVIQGTPLKQNEL